jgi:hypothetical protein
MWWTNENDNMQMKGFNEQTNGCNEESKVWDE